MVGAAVVAATLAATTAAVAHRAVAGCTADHGKRLVLTRSYRFALRLGRAENMYMPYQVRASHPKHGEVMLRGRMTIPLATVNAPLHHLEVQICARPTGAVVIDANPTIVLVDATAKGKSRKLPVAVMEGVGEGLADLHYGNNVALRTGHRYTVTVTWRGERAIFRLTAPHAS